MTESRSRAAAIVAWIDEDQARRERETLRAQGRNQVLHALLRGTLQIRNPATGEWIKIPSPWTDADQRQWGMTREQIAQLAISYEGLPPDDDTTAAGAQNAPADHRARPDPATRHVPPAGPAVRHHSHMSSEGWGRTFLARCGINPDDETDVRAGYENCREAHARWLATGQGDIDAESYGMLVDAIKDLYGWQQFPPHWPAPTLVMMPQPLRNLLSRASGTGAPGVPN